MKKITTKKEAKKAGLRTASGWRQKGKLPLRGIRGIRVKGDTFFREDQCEQLFSRTQIKKMKRVIKKYSRIAKRQYGYKLGCIFPLFRLSDTQPK